MPGPTKKGYHKKHNRRSHSTTLKVAKYAENEPAVVVVGKIFAHWCGHCQTLLPEWKKLVHVIKTKSKSNRKSHTKYVFSEIEQSHQNAGIMHINQTYLKGTGHQLALQGGFPTLFKISDGKLEYYNGPRTYLDMLRWYMSNPEKTAIAKEIGGTPGIVQENVPLPLSKYESVGGKTRRRRIHHRKSRSRG